MGSVAIVGAGKLGERHCTAYADIPDAQVTGVLEPLDERYAALVQSIGRPLHRYGSLAALLDDPRVEIVDICSPTSLHAEQATAALGAGRSVFCEKPLVPTLDELGALRQIASEVDRTVRVGYLYRFHPRLQRLARRLDDDALGAARFALLRIGGRGSHRAWKHDRSAGGGALLDMASHMIDTAQWLFGPIDEIDALHTNQISDTRRIGGSPVLVDAEDHVIVRLRSRSGVEIVVHADFLSPGFSHSIEVSGDNGTASVSVITSVPDRYVLSAAASDLAPGETIEPGNDADMLGRQLTSFLADHAAGRVVREFDGSQLVAEVVEAFVGAPAGVGSRCDG